MNDPNRNDDDDDSPPATDKGNQLLEEFRQKWQKELKSDDLSVGASREADNEPNKESNEKVDEDKVNYRKTVSSVREIFNKKKILPPYRQNHCSPKPLSWKNWVKYSKR